MVVDNPFLTIAIDRFVIAVAGADLNVDAVLILVQMRVLVLSYMLFLLPLPMVVDNPFLTIAIDRFLLLSLIVCYC